MLPHQNPFALQTFNNNNTNNNPNKKNKHHRKNSDSQTLLHKLIKTTTKSSINSRNSTHNNTKNIKIIQQKNKFMLTTRNLRSKLFNFRFKIQQRPHHLAAGLLKNHNHDHPNTYFATTEQDQILNANCLHLVHSSRSLNTFHDHDFVDDDGLCHNMLASRSQQFVFDNTVHNNTSYYSNQSTDDNDDDGFFN